MVFLVPLFVLCLQPGEQATEPTEAAQAVKPPAAAQQPPTVVVLKPSITDAALLNPGMGIYYMTGPTHKPDPEQWFMKICGVAYVRCHWSDLEPERGQYRFDEYFGPMFEYWVSKLGKRVAFRVMCESMHGNTKYVTPKWVFDEGVPGVKHRGLYAEEQIDPVFWDPKYLDLQCEFLRALGKWADGRPGLEFVDIGSIGEWGEMHFGEHLPGRWTHDEMVATGFTEFKLVQAYRRVIDTFAEAFPHTRVFLNVGGLNSINDYAAMRGLHFRQDGLGQHGASYNVESRLYPLYGFRGVQCNLELIVGYEDMKARGWDALQVIKKGLEAPLSYQNINFGRVIEKDTPQDVREAVEYCARHIGYRFALVEVRLPAEVHAWADLNGRLPLQQVWENRGVAPCYENLALEWGLFAPDGRVVATHAEFPEPPTTLWMPGKPVNRAALLAFSAGVQPGKYLLGVRLFLPERPEQRYYLPMEEGAPLPEGWYRVGEVDLLPGVAGPSQVSRWDFEGELLAVSTPKGMSATVAEEPVHGGTHALALRGSCENTWSYGIVAHLPLVPGARYRLSGWMLVRRLEGLRETPSLKVGINDAEDKWITNATTGAYRTDAMGQWQELSVEFDVPVSGAFGYICVERNSFSGKADIEMYVDDIELRMTAAP